MPEVPRSKSWTMEDILVSISITLTHDLASESPMGVQLSVRTSQRFPLCHTASKILSSFVSRSMLVPFCAAPGGMLIVCMVRFFVWGVALGTDPPIEYNLSVLVLP